MKTRGDVRFLNPVPIRVPSAESRADAPERSVERDFDDAYNRCMSSDISSTTSQPLRLTKLEAARRQLEMAIRLYFEHGDEVSIHTLAAAAYAIVRDINDHRGGEPMLKDLHCYLSADVARDFKRYINAPDNFLKHADKDPEGTGELNLRWTEALIWEASRKYCEMTGNWPIPFLTFILWFIVRHPGLRAQLERDCASQGLSDRLAAALRLPFDDRRRFFATLN
jgi:hypothetical protein